MHETSIEGIGKEENYMKAVIYGIGKRFHKIFTDQELIKEIFVENDIEIVGSSDRTVGFGGQRFIYRGESLPVKKVDEFLKNDIKIIVTSKIYFEEIKQELCKIGYKENQIMLIDYGGKVTQKIIPIKIKFWERFGYLMRRICVKLRIRNMILFYLQIIWSI